MPPHAGRVIGQVSRCVPFVDELILDESVQQGEQYLLFGGEVEVEARSGQARAAGKVIDGNLV